MFQRIHDWRHERYIARLRKNLAWSMGVKDHAKSWLYWDLMAEAIKARSPAQVARMESAMGLHA